MDTANSDGQFYTDERDIHRLLHGIQSKLSPLSIRIEHGPQTYTSYIIECDRDKGVFYLDEVIPKSGNRRLLDGESFSFETYADGCRIRAKDLTAKGVRSAEGDVVLAIRYPNSVHFLQRRQSYRAPVRKTLDIVVKFTNKNKQGFESKLRDFSLEGCQLEMPLDQSHKFAVDHQPVYGQLLFPDGSELRTKLIFLRIRYDEVLKVTLLGCRFSQLTSAQIKMIAMINTELQRDHINFVKNGGHISGIPSLFLPREDDMGPVPLDPESPEPVAEAETEAEATQDSTLKAKPASACQALLQKAHNALATLCQQAQWQQSINLKPLQVLAAQLCQQLQQDRTPLMLGIHKRSPDQFLVSHLLASGIYMADQALAMRKLELMPVWMLAGFLHGLAWSGIGQGLHSNATELKADELKDYRLRLQWLLTELKQQQVSAEILVAISQHLGHLDGSGLPGSLNDGNMHQLGKLMAIVSYFDRRSYQMESPLCFFNPVASFKRLLSRGHNFDKALSKHFIARQGLQPLASGVRLNNDMLGLVLGLDEQRKPNRVRLLFDLNENQRLAPVDVSLGAGGMEVISHVDSAQYGLAEQYLKEF